MRKLLLVLALGVAGCSNTAELKNPVSGAIVTCHAWPLHEVNPWSGYQLCIEEYVSEGYQRVD